MKQNLTVIVQKAAKDRERNSEDLSKARLADEEAKSKARLANKTAQYQAQGRLEMIKGRRRADEILNGGNPRINIPCSSKSR